MSESNSTLYDIIKAEETELEEVLPKPSLTLTEIISMLNGRIDKAHLRILEQLNARGRRSEVPVPVSPHDILSNTDEIEQKIGALAYHYERNGRIIIPRRPIVYIQFEPLHIKFQLRRYRDGPLAFFMQHKNTYKGLTRTELYRFDPPLYSALRMRGQLNKAIPQTRWYTDEETRLLYGELRKRRPNIERLAKELGRSPSGIAQKLLRLSHGIPSKGAKQPARRNYCGNPLAYFKENIMCYAGMSRRELSMADAALYKALRHYNQLDEAIPQRLSYQGPSCTLEELGKLREGIKAGLNLEALATLLHRGESALVRKLRRLTRKNRKLWDPKVCNEYRRESFQKILSKKDRYNFRYTPQELQVLRNGIKNNRSPEELAEMLERGVWGIASKLRSLSRMDPKHWKPEIVDVYYSYVSSVYR